LERVMKKTSSSPKPRRKGKKGEYSPGQQQKKVMGRKYNNSEGGGEGRLETTLEGTRHRQPKDRGETRVQRTSFFLQAKKKHPPSTCHRRATLRLKAGRCEKKRSGRSWLKGGGLGKGVVIIVTPLPQVWARKN